MIHINNFIDKIKFFESKNSKDFIMPISEAKNLHTDITKLLLVLNDKKPHTETHNTTNKIDEMSGGDW